MHKQNCCEQWAACSEVQAIMRQMSSYWEPTAGRGDTSLLLLVRLTLSHSLASLSFASHALLLFLPLLQTCEHAHMKIHTPPPPPLVLIIPLQIHRSISSLIIVPPAPPHPPPVYLPLHPQLLSIQVGERSCPLSPCQPRWPGSSGSHNPSCPITALRGGRAQLDDSVLPEERRKEI